VTKGGFRGEKERDDKKRIWKRRRVAGKQRSMTGKFSEA
jgi:hypothetical protein